MVPVDLARGAEQISTLAEGLLRDHPSLPSAAVALMSADGAQALVAHGVADPATGDPLTVDHAYRIASCTKSFVAASVVTLVAEGQVMLDAPVIDLLPADTAELFTRFEHGRSVTVRQLLQHRSGLVDHSTFPEFAAPAAREWTPTGQLAIAVARPALCAPGAAFAYSDSGYVVLGQMIEHLTGQPLATAVRDRAGIDARTMPSLHWELVESTPAGVVRAHQLFDGHDTHDWNPTFDLFGGGGLVSTLLDLARWWSSWFGGAHGDIAQHLADPAPTLDPRSVPFPAGDRVGLGLFGRRVHGLTVWSHGGFWGLETGHVPELGVSYAVSLTHRAAGLPGPLQLADAVVASLTDARR